MTLRLSSGQACHGYGAAALQNGVLEPDFIGRELCSTATSWPCGPGKHNIILNLMRMGEDAPPQREDALS